MHWKPNNVLVPVDFSEGMFAALEMALGLTEDASRLHVVHVLPPTHVLTMDAHIPIIDDTARIQSARNQLDERLSGSIFASAARHTIVGDPGRCITSLARELETDLIVIPSHGRHGLGELLLGSVAERVVRTAPCPVLVLRPGAR